MKRKTKRRIGIFLVVAMLAVLVFPAFSAMADGEADFTIDGGVLVDYHGAGGDVTIPDSVTAIADGAFQDDNGVTSVTIPGSVTEIGNEAFEGCTGLTSITIPSGVTSIGSSTFNGCTALTDIYVDQAQNDTLFANASVPDGCKIHWNSTGSGSGSV